MIPWLLFPTNPIEIAYSKNKVNEFKKLIDEEEDIMKYLPVFMDSVTKKKYEMMRFMTKHRNFLVKQEHYEDVFYNIYMHKSIHAVHAILNVHNEDLVHHFLSKFNLFHQDRKDLLKFICKRYTIKLDYIVESSMLIDYIDPILLIGLDEMFLYNVRETINVKDSKGNSLLLKFAIAGNIDLVRNLVDKEYVELNSTNNQGYNILSYAIVHEWIDIIKILVSKDVMLFPFKLNDIKIPFVGKIQVKRETLNFIEHFDDFDDFLSMNKENLIFHHS